MAEDDSASLVPLSLRKSWRQLHALFHFAAALSALFVTHELVATTILVISFEINFVRHFLALLWGGGVGLPALLSSAGEYGFALLFISQRPEIVSMALVAKAAASLSLVVMLLLFSLSAARSIKL